MKILLTGGLGFVGSALARDLKQHGHHVIVLDNLRRRGSELNLASMKATGVEFVHGDVRVLEDIMAVGAVDVLIEASAEPSVLAGYKDPRYMLNTNLSGALNCLEFVRQIGAGLLFLSSSRVYPVQSLAAIPLQEGQSRFEMVSDKQAGETLERCDRGILCQTPPAGSKTLYGASKLSVEHVCLEYVHAFDVPVLINRCSVLAGPGQFGRVDQGFVALWTAAAVYGFELRYIGYGGSGKQVRDVLHIEDLCSLIRLQLERCNDWRGEVFHASGGRAISTSLFELSQKVEAVSGANLNIDGQQETRSGDAACILLDSTFTGEVFGWQPMKSIDAIVEDVYKWMKRDQETLQPVLGGKS